MLRSSFVVSCAFLFMLFGCGRAPRLSRGDQLEVVTDLREKATVDLDQGYSDGFTCMIPAGSVVTVMNDPSRTAAFFDIEVTKLEGVSNRAEIDLKLVPPSIRNRTEYKNFHLSVPMTYIGTKLKKL